MSTDPAHTHTPAPTQLSEQRLLAWIASRYQKQSGVILGPGDDMAILESGRGPLLIAADPVIEGVHVSRGTDPRKTGTKAVKRNLSDVAAMGALPKSVVSCVVFNQAWSESAAKQLLEGIDETASAYACSVVGGDISIHGGPTVVVITLLADTGGVEPLRRSTANAGDHVYVSGLLGGSQAEHEGWTGHLDFTPRVTLGRTLASNADLRPTAMMDLSDGLAMDLPRMLAASGGLGATIELDRLPLNPAISGSSDPGWKSALGDGEDYELLLTHPGDLPPEIEGVPITRIGQVEPGGSALRYLYADGSIVAVEGLAGLGWEHRS
ncbi:MAG: thiamine-phosphate kinase [Phycisphaeraceae bacterium]